MLRISLITLSLFALTGCTNLLQPNSETDSTSRPPSSWVQASQNNHGKIATGWIDEFQDKTMKRLVLEALDNNPNLGAAAATLRATERGTIRTKAGLLPRLNASTSGSRSIDFQGNDPSTRTTNLGLSLNASWEPDIWGRLKDLNDASRHSLNAAIEDHRGARLSLAANTARAWSNFITAEQQYQLAKHTLDSFQKNLNIIERNYKAGVPGTRALAVQLSRTNVAEARGELENSKLQHGNAARDLEILLGRYPSNKITATATLPHLKNRAPAGLPAELLARRPDIAAARHNIYATAKLADVARKNLLPTINLTGLSSSSEENYSNLLDPQNLALSIAASLAQPLYNGGELKADAQATLAENEASILNYTEIVLAAFGEVEDALQAEEALMNQELHLNTEVKQASLAEKQAEMDFSEGVEGVDIISLLESQRRANDARSSLIILRNQRIQNRIDLHLALGGDFLTLDTNH